MFDPDNYPITIAELTHVRRELDSVLTEDEKDRMIDWLALNPTAGDIIVATNGVRKCRWSYGRQGKRGGLRILYYFRDLNMPIYILAVYKKNEKLSITAGEKQMMRKLVEELVDVYAAKRVQVIARQVG
ncbi:addiction module toxin RelE [Cypionkella sp. TWP1-2-1b2]|uniref:addiction module toxin RelE n=1 Tax=Cypionkella sp. TWP1-2-1b2 TaxID=2804675 RepID=UPI003CF5AB2B